ncbi:MAG: phosphoribosylanthranilate isomerase [Candidatus Methanoplasma sp.]|jgi:phosphoribosylanthranilate isomerase|nr:phosphoribosylanthranilate isomerase [Candidatus Methanoplasma sp.]
MMIKICGLFREDDVQFVNEAFPDYAGFVFAESRRKVSPEQAKALRAALIPDIIPVGVFRDADADAIAGLYSDGIIDVAQLHGGEGPELVDSLKEQGITTIKTVSVSGAEDVRNACGCGADYVMFDNGSGGTGERFDWSLLSHANGKFFLAGGIDAGNIGDAAATGAYAADVSSGAETGGVKDRDKIRTLVMAAHSQGSYKGGIS